LAQEKTRDKRGKNSTEEERVNSSPSQKTKKSLFIIVLLILLILGGGIAFRLGLASNLLGGVQKGSQENTLKEPEFMYEVPEIVVNVNGNGKSRFLSVKFYLGFDEPKLQQELEKRMPEIRDAVNKILWVKDADDVSTLEGKEALREEILDTVNGMLHSGELRGVYFWHLMIQ